MLIISIVHTFYVKQIYVQLTMCSQSKQRVQEG